MSKIKINCRLEGGVGDCLLGCRFLPAIKEKHPDSNITLWFDSNGKDFQAKTVSCLYSHLFDDYKIIPSKKYSEFWVDCQFGTDNFYGAIENVPDDIRKEMTEDCDVFYNLHIDGLKWITYDFDWRRYFYFFPRPQIANSEQIRKDLGLPNSYVVVHLHSDSSVGHVLEDFYVDGLLKKVSEFVHVVVIATEKTKHFYKNYDNVTILVQPIEKVLPVIEGAKCMVSTDSGFRYVAYGCNVPTIVFSANCVAPQTVPYSHRLRWLMFTEHCLPLNYSFVFVSKTVRNILENPMYSLFPFVQDADRELVNRKYTINLEKTKL